GAVAPGRPDHTVVHVLHRGGGVAIGEGAVCGFGRLLGCLCAHAATSFYACTDATRASISGAKARWAQTGGFICSGGPTFPLLLEHSVHDAVEIAAVDQLGLA